MAISELGPNIDISIFPCHEAMEDSEGDDSAYINRVVCLNSDKEVCYPTAITDIPVGVLIEGGAVGTYVTYRAFGVVPVKAGEIMTMPKKIGIYNDGGTIDGRVGAIVSTNHIVGMLLDTADAEDDIVSAIINCINPGILV
jgi:hypothetical protein